MLYRYVMILDIYRGLNLLESFGFKMRVYFRNLSYKLILCQSKGENFIKEGVLTLNAMEGISWPHFWIILDCYLNEL